jgi:Bacterial SH3 domain
VRRARSLVSVTLLLASGSLLSACTTASVQPEPAPTPSRSAVEEAKRVAVHQELEERAARQQLLLMEREAQVKLLTQKLDAAILEVVRAMAKLRGLESRAEAASNLAETEIAVKALPRDAAARQKDSDLTQAEQLLTLAAAEFKKENYSGTVYLTNQAKTLIKARETRSVESLPKMEGEVPFSAPLTLRALNKSNVREGPGPTFKVLFAVGPDAALTAYSYRGLWVRIKANDGRNGWIHYSLIDQR